MGRILVTGATGFTGSALTRRLVQEGHQVTAFVRESSDVTGLQELGVEIVRLDITDYEQVARHMRPFDRVFHVAASFRREHADLREFSRVNVDATRHLLQAALDQGVGRFIHCSTIGVHGGVEPGATESYRFKPNDHYQRSKLEGELLAHEYFAKGLPGTVIRPAGIYGPGDRRFLKLFKAIKKGFFVMIGRGDTLFHMVYIDDLVQGFLLASEREEALNEVFIIGSERHCTINEIVREVAAALHVRQPRLRVPLRPVYLAAALCEDAYRTLGLSSPPLYRRRVEFFQMNRSFDIGKARRLLGYEPRFDLKQGIEATARSYEALGLI
ncbi:MAG TPA: NAD-dependent epimerase/dehydratase family protein [Woeseiaceae bacterium]|nr:NAD-dependent epimerase/dehydratase family protein [Woeseiaceae bacterium]